MTSAQIKEESFNEDIIKKEQSKDGSQLKKQIHVEMLDEQKSSKQETLNNSQRIMDQNNNPVGQVTNLMEQDLNVLNAAN